jgi:hypothetical protein
MPRKRKANPPAQPVSVKVSADERKKLKEWARAYPDKPGLGETAHRLLQRELEKDKRG